MAKKTTTKKEKVSESSESISLTAFEKKLCETSPIVEAQVKANKIAWQKLHGK